MTHRLTSPSQSVSSGSLSYRTEHHGKEDHHKGKRFRFAVDFAYTLNHAIVCTLTDPITDVPIGATVQNVMAKARKSGERVTFAEVRQGLNPRNIVGELKSTMSFQKEDGEKFSPATSWLAGEVAGDFGAVPVVVGLQHFAPKLMEGIGRLAAPIASPVFRRSAMRSARAEFKLAGMDVDTPEFDARVAELQQRELEDLPKAIMWTAVSPTINIIMQKAVMQNPAPVTDLIMGKAIGATVTSGLTVGLRATSPRHAQKWDDVVSKKAGKPVSTVVAKILGIDKEELREGMKEKAKHHKHGGSWAERTAPQPNGEIQR
jgi:hypothetical protein